MVEDAVDDMRGELQPRHAGRRRAAKVVQDPRLDFVSGRLRHEGVQPLLGAAEAANRRSAVGRENRDRDGDAGQGGEDVDRLRGQVDVMALIVLRLLPRQRP